MNPFLSQNNIGSFQGARSNHVQVAPAQAGNNLDTLLGLARPNDFGAPANDGLDRINFYPDRQDSFRPPGNQPSSIFDNLPSSSTYGQHMHRLTLERSCSLHHCCLKGS